MLRFSKNMLYWINGTSESILSAETTCLHFWISYPNPHIGYQFGSTYITGAAESVLREPFNQTVSCSKTKFRQLITKLVRKPDDSYSAAVVLNQICHEPSNSYENEFSNTSLTEHSTVIESGTLEFCRIFFLKQSCRVILQNSLFLTLLKFWSKYLKGSPSLVN